MSYLQYSKPIAARGPDASGPTKSDMDSKVSRKLRSYQKDLQRHKIKFNYPVYFLWFHYIKLALELEELGHVIPTRGAKGKEDLESGKAIVVKREAYQGWNLTLIPNQKFHQWCTKTMVRHLAQHHSYRGRPQYDAFVKRFNVYVRYLNHLASHGKDFDRTDFAYDVITRLEAVRYLRVTRSNNQNLSEYTRIVWKDIKAAEEALLNCCHGKFG